MAGEVRVEVRAVTDQFDAALRRSEKEANNFDKAATQAADNGVNRLDNGLRRSAKGASEFNAAVNRSQSGLRAIKGATTQLGFQLQDIAIQAQAGTNAFVILGQQGSQILSLLGPFGALAGAALAIGAAVAGPLVTAFGDAEKSAEDVEREFQKLINRYDELTLAQRRYVESQAGDKISDLRKKLSELRNEADSLQSALRAPIRFPDKDLKQMSDRLVELRSEIDSTEQKIGEFGEKTSGASQSVISLSQDIAILQLEYKGLHEEAAIASALFSAGNKISDETRSRIVELTKQQYALNQAIREQSKAEQEANRAREEAKRKAEQQARQIENQIQANDKLVETLNNRLALALEGDARKQAQMTAMQRLNEQATEDQKQSVEELAGALYDLGIAQEKAAAIKQANMDFSSRIVGLRNQIEATKMMTAAVGGNKEEMRAAKVEAEKFNLSQELIIQAWQREGEVTEEARAAIDNFVNSYGMLIEQHYIELDVLSQTQKKYEEYQKGVENFQNALAEGFTNLIFNAGSFEDSLKSMILQISQAIVQAQILKAIQSTMGGSSGGGSSYGTIANALISAFQYHDGGSVGSSGVQRNVPASAFIGAPRFHNGLRADEFPAILQRGEEVISKRDVQNGARRERGDTIINVTTPDADSFRMSRRQMQRETRMRGY